MKRDLILDALRGLMLVLMTIDHMKVLELREYTYQTYGFFTAADGFFFLSGLVYGLVYAKYSDQPVFIKKKSWKRALTIYKFHIAVCVIFIVESLIMHFYFGQTAIRSVSEIIQQPVEYGIKYLMLIHNPGWFGILPLYIVFLIIAPFIIRQFHKGNTIWVLSFSFMVWVFVQLPFTKNMFSTLEQMIGTKFSGFNIFEWQLIFIAGMYNGVLKRQDKLLFSIKPHRIIVAASIATGCIFLKHYFDPSNRLVDIMFGTENLSLIRIINFFSFVYLIAWIKQHFNFTKRGFLGYLGQYSLEVYAFHILLITHFNNLFPLFSHNLLFVYLFPILLILALIIPAVVAEYFKKGKPIIHIPFIFRKINH
ncbi:MAG: acyltransferase family protein [Bacteroidetes bacterium]|nr:acyltransferase family protein [Bacteroidota bacterium]